MVQNAASRPHHMRKGWSILALSVVVACLLTFYAMPAFFAGSWLQEKGRFASGMLIERSTSTYGTDWVVVRFRTDTAEQYQYRYYIPGDQYPHIRVSERNAAGVNVYFLPNYPRIFLIEDIANVAYGYLVFAASLVLGALLNLFNCWLACRRPAAST